MITRPICLISSSIEQADESASRLCWAYGTHSVARLVMSAMGSLGTVVKSLIFILLWVVSEHERDELATA